jgi:hypothetical protein
MSRELSVQGLWEAASSGEGIFQPADIGGLPEASRRYLEHAIAPGTKLAQAVRLRMHGEIKLQRWLPFRAEQATVWGRGFIWRATVSMFGMPIKGSDRLVDEEGAMKWKLFGLIPVMTASGPDISRSAAGRVAGEAVWIPSVLCSREVTWKACEPSTVKAKFTAHGATSELELAIDDKGRVKAASQPRWGNPDNTEFRYVQFGVIAEEEGTFGGCTIPTRFRAGWYLGTDRFDSEGEFFRATIDDAQYR